MRSCRWRLPLCVAAVAALSGWPPARAAPDIAVFQENVVVGDLATFQPTVAIFAPGSSEVVSLVISTGLDTNGQLQNWNISTTRPQSSFDLGQPDPLHAALSANDLAVVFNANPDTLTIFPDLGAPLEAVVLVNGNDSTFRPAHVSLTPEVEGRTRRAMVWEWQHADDVFDPDDAEQVLSVYDYGDGSITLRSSLSSKEYRDPTEISLLHEPAAAFNPTNESQYFATDGGSIIRMFGIFSDGALQLEKSQMVMGSDSTAIRAMALSADGRFLATTHGERASIYETPELDFRHSTGDFETDHTGVIGQVTCLCWSPGNKYLIVGRTAQNTTIVEFDTNQFVDFDVILENSRWDSRMCAFAHDRDVFVMDSILENVLNTQFNNINLTTYIIGDGNVQGATPGTDKTDDEVDDPFNDGTVDASCFPATATVELRHGDRVAMDTLTVGDSVLVGVEQGQPVYDTVFAFSHRDTSRTLHPFVELRHQNGSLQLSAGHIVSIQNSESQRLSVPARKVAVGDYLVSSSSGHLLRVDTVAEVQNTGLYNPHTLQNRLAVDGVVVSTFTESVDERVAKLLLWPVKVVFKVTGLNLVHRLLDDDQSYLSPLRALVELLKRGK